MRALIEGVKFALLALVVYLCALPFIFFAGVGVIILFLANAYLLGREYFELAAMRFRPPHEAKALRKANAPYIFLAGMVIAVFVSIPLVNLATPIFAMAYMVHIHKRMTGPRRGADRAAALNLALRRVPVLFQIGDQRRAEMAIGLLSGIDRHVAAERVERLFADAEGAPVAGGADHARAGEILDRARDRRRPPRPAARSRRRSCGLPAYRSRGGGPSGSPAARYARRQSAAAANWRRRE